VCTTVRCTWHSFFYVDTKNIRKNVGAIRWNDIIGGNIRKTVVEHREIEREIERGRERERGRESQRKREREGEGEREPERPTTRSK
jgi:hypothetical protein